MRNFTIIPNQIFEQSQLSVPARYLYCVLLKYCGKNEWCFPSQKTLGGVFGYSDKHIRTLLNELIEVKLISKKRRGWNRSNTYRVVKLLFTDRIPTSALIQTPSTPQSGNTVPIHPEPEVPPKSTYLKGKDKNSVKGRERVRQKLVELGLKRPITVVIKPNNDKQMSSLIK